MLLLDKKKEAFKIMKKRLGRLPNTNIEQFTNKGEKAC